MNVVLVGLSHHVAPIELRERVALDAEAARSLARDLAADGHEAVCLSTCNRTELYLAGPDAGALEERGIRALGAIGDLRDDAFLSAVYRLHDQAAARHLFRVAAGLDSLVPGESEILGQVRAAYERGAVGTLLDRLFRQAVYVGRKVRSETAIGESAASVSSAAAALAEQVFGELARRRVLVIGAGKVGDLAARNLVSRGAELRFVANRTSDRAVALARRVGGEAIPLSRIATELAGADIVVSSTAAPGYVLERDVVEQALRTRKGKPLLLIDLAVPRDLDPAIHGLDGCYLYDIDDLDAVVSETLAGRREEAAKAEELVATEAERFRAWQASLDVVPAIASLRARAEEIRVQELAKLEGRFSEPDLRAVDSLTAQIVNKLLHLPTVRMKQAAAAAEGVLYADAVRHLFGLGEEQR